MNNIQFHMFHKLLSQRMDNYVAYSFPGFSLWGICGIKQFIQINNCVVFILLD